MLVGFGGCWVCGPVVGIVEVVVVGGVAANCGSACASRPLILMEEAAPDQVRCRKASVRRWTCARRGSSSSPSLPGADDEAGSEGPREMWVAGLERRAEGGKCRSSFARAQVESWDWRCVRSRGDWSSILRWCGFEATMVVVAMIVLLFDCVGCIAPRGCEVYREEKREKRKHCVQRSCLLDATRSQSGHVDGYRS